MATTSPDNIWTPDAGDDYALTTDLAAMADTIQDAITANKTGAIGVLANRPAAGTPGLPEGFRYYATDVDLTYLYDGAAWLSANPGMYLLTPPAATGTGVTLSGARIDFVGSSQVDVDQVFTTRFDRYRIIGRLNNVTANTALQMTFKSGGGAVTATNAYRNQRNYGNNANVPQSTNVSATNTFEIGGGSLLTTAPYAAFEVDVDGPAVSGRTIFGIRMWQMANGEPLAMHGGGMFAGNNLIDGFRFTATGATGWMKVYGLA